MIDYAKSPSAPAAQEALNMRPLLSGTRHLISAGHYLAAHAGFEVLESGGNAIDAGVAAGLTLGVVQSDLVNIAGVAPIMLYLAQRSEVLTISGLGTWPAAASLERFEREFGGHIPEGIARTVVPAAPDAWITALEHYGTMSFGDVAAAAIRFADEGFVMYPLMAELIALNAERYARWPSNAEIYLPGGRPPVAGERFVQRDLAASLRYMVDEERAAAARGREAGLQAARDAFYRGDIATEIVRYHSLNGGMLSADDLASFRVAIEAPVRTRFAGTDVYACGPWCQGPVLAQTLNLLAVGDLAALGHNSPAYVHRLLEALKLAYADREAFYGDPRFVDVPVQSLLSKAYADARRELIRDERACSGMPPPGDPPAHAARAADEYLVAPTTGAAPTPALDTSYVCVVDRDGNVFSATPSDTSYDTPVIPGTGLCPSSRGSQSWAKAGHPSSVAPGKRPRLTPNPAIAIHEGEFVMPFGTPGGDVQCQAMLQVFLNVTVFGMDAQAAVEAPRFATFNFPNSFEPHAASLDLVRLEERIPREVGDALHDLGHDVQWWPAWTWVAGAVCLIHADRRTGILSAGADQRRPAYALGW
ncbi:MAG: gamma-glutamyltransferase family protein [Gammaproteobacteria bacterium]